MLQYIELVILKDFQSQILACRHTENAYYFSVYFFIQPEMYIPWQFFDKNWEEDHKSSMKFTRLQMFF